MRVRLGRPGRRAGNSVGGKPSGKILTGKLPLVAASVVWYGLALLAQVPVLTQAQDLNPHDDVSQIHSESDGRVCSEEDGNLKCGAEPVDDTRIGSSNTNDLDSISSIDGIVGKSTNKAKTNSGIENTKSTTGSASKSDTESANNSESDSKSTNSATNSATNPSTANKSANKSANNSLAPESFYLQHGYVRGDYYDEHNENISLWDKVRLLR
jgi:hypothetical protein